MSLETGTRPSNQREILQRGLLMRPGGFTLGQTEPLAVRAERTRGFNRIGRLETDFFSLDTAYTIASASIINDGVRDERLAAAIPFSPRARESLIVAAGNLALVDPEKSDTEGDVIKTHFVTDLDPKTQAVFWSTLLGATRALAVRRDKLREDPRHCRPIITMNASPQFSGDSVETSSALTIGAPHAFTSLHRTGELIMLAEGDPKASKRTQYMRVDQAQQGGYSKEQLFLMRNPAKDLIVARLAERFGEFTEQHSDLSFNIEYRSKAPPYGWEVQVTKAGGEKLKGSEMAEIMACHHELYRDELFGLMDPYIPESMRPLLRIQPSTTVLMTLGQNEDPKSEDPYNLRIAIRPVLSSSAGPLEVSGQMTETFVADKSDEEKEVEKAAKVRFARETYSEAILGGLMEEHEIELETLEGAIAEENILATRVPELV